MSDNTYTYTEWDFAQAQFATLPDATNYPGRLLVRVNNYLGVWRDGCGVHYNDSDMVEIGCIPVYAEPYSQEALNRAWEHGEKPKMSDRAAEGTVVASKPNDAGHIKIYTLSEGVGLLPTERVLYNPPLSDDDEDEDEDQNLKDIRERLDEMPFAKYVSSDVLDQIADDLADVFLKDKE